MTGIMEQHRVASLGSVAGDRPGVHEPRAAAATPRRGLA